MIKRTVTTHFAFQFLQHSIFLFHNLYDAGLVGGVITKSFDRNGEV